MFLMTEDRIYMNYNNALKGATEMYKFPVTRTTHPKEKPDQKKLGFGKYFTDHMFMIDYDEGQGWHDGRIVPHEPIAIEPASCVLHYAQMMFEGMKAYKHRRETFSFSDPIRILSV